MKFSEQPNIDTLKSEHLSSDFSPIYVCVEPKEFNVRKRFNKTFEEFNQDELVDFFGNPNKMKERGYLIGGRESYVISSIDSGNKASFDYINCTGIVACGVDKETGKNISLLTHQDPSSFLYNEKEDFERDLDLRLNELKNRSKEGSVDVLIIGGNAGQLRVTAYKKSVEKLTAAVEKVFGFVPPAIEPKGPAGADDAYYDTENRRLHFFRHNAVGWKNNGSETMSADDAKAISETKE